MSKIDLQVRHIVLEQANPHRSILVLLVIEEGLPVSFPRRLVSVECLGLVADDLGLLLVVIVLIQTALNPHGLIMMVALLEVGRLLDLAALVAFHDGVVFEVGHRTLKEGELLLRRTAVRRQSWRRVVD